MKEQVIKIFEQANKNIEEEIVKQTQLSIKSGNTFHYDKSQWLYHEVMRLVKEIKD